MRISGHPRGKTHFVPLPLALSRENSPHHYSARRTAFVLARNTGALPWATVRHLSCRAAAAAAPLKDNETGTVGGDISSL